MARNFPALKEDQKLQRLQDAVLGDAQRFFLKETISSSADPQPSLAKLRAGTARHASIPVNISSLSLLLRGK